MSLEVKLVSVSHLKGKYDRFAKLTFRGVSYTSDILENCAATAKFNQVFNWPLSSFLEPEESIEIRLYNSNKIFQDRLVAAYTQSLAIAVAQGSLDVCDNLLSSKLRVLRQEVKFEVKYLKPGPADFFDDVDNREDTRSRRSFRSTVTTRSQPISESGIGGIVDLLEDKELYHPKIHQPAVVNPVPSDWQVQLRIIEARELAGMTLDPVVTIKLGDQTKNTTVKPQTNNPFWDEFFCFDLVLPQQQAMDHILMMDVYTGRNIISQGTVIGSFKVDLWYIYRKEEHCLFSKWAPLVDGANTECRGYLRLDISVFGKGDMQRDPPQRKDKDEDIEFFVEIELDLFHGYYEYDSNTSYLLQQNVNLIYPDNVLLCRPVYKYVFKIYKAEGLPQMNAKLMANFKKALTRKVQDMADPFVEVTFAGVKGKTGVRKNTYKPEFLEQIIFTEFFPALCKTIKIQIKDSDAVSDEVIGTHCIDIEMIQNEDPTVGFLPVFGPSWVNFYGSTRDYSMFDEHIDLNNGIGEGISYRGRLLMSIDCYEDQPDETGIVSVDDVAPIPPTSYMSRDGIKIHSSGEGFETPTNALVVEETKNIIGKEQPHFLFATFYEASMIPKKLGDKPIQFEVTIGEFGVYLEDEPAVNANKQPSTPTGDFESIDGEEEFISERVYAKTMTKPLKPQCLASQKYFSIPWESDKPCTYLKFPFEDQRRRSYNAIMLAKMFNTLTENLEEMDERHRLHLKNNHRLLRRFMGDIVHMSKLFIDLADGKKTGTHLGKNPLDKQRLKMCLFEVHTMSKQAGDIASKCTAEANMESLLQSAHSLLKKLKKIVYDPQHTLPDIFVWMLSGGKRVAYTRIPATDVFFSKVDFERGRNAGRVQTIFLRLPGKRGLGEKGWAIQAKIEVRFWLGLLNKHQGEYWRDLPSGYERPEDMILSLPPERLIYYEKQKFIVRAHIYQARSLIGSDDSGLSDAFARVICTNQAQETYVVWKTRSPTWDQMLKFDGIELWGELAEFAVNPPVIVIEIFDKDDDLFGGGDIEFIGRALAKPMVKAAEEAYKKPFFPPVLQWFPIYRGEMKAGELLAAFEMLQVTEDMEPEFMPLDPELRNTDEGLKMAIPDNIRPVMKKHRVEVMFWGVREMKRAQLMNINRPQADIDCCYTVQLLDNSTLPCVNSKPCKDASKNPNFDSPIVVFDVDLPENKKYIPPVTIRIHDIRAFGRKILAGTHVIDSLYDYFRDKEQYHRKKPEEEVPADAKRKVDDDGDITIEIPVTAEEPAATPVKKKKTPEESDKEEEVLDWWTRFYETLRDQQEKSKPKSTLFGSKSPSPEKKGPENRIPRLTVYDNELEEVEGFDIFNDFMETFPLLRGKKTDDENDEIRRFSGKFKGNIRVWNEGLPRGFDELDPKGTFYKLPSNEPIKILVRVYVIRCLNLHPTDPNGKADPYLVVSLGKKTYKDRDNYVSKQLSPEFGRVFEFNAQLPFDNMLRVQVYDWDLMSGDDLIGETEIDIENLFYSKHRATCGLQENYVTHGYAKWRDPQKPTQILTKLCKDEGLDGPTFGNGVCTVEDIEFVGDASIKDAKGREKPSDEPCALEALRNFDKIPRGYKLVPEYVESRSLFNPEKPGLEQGRVQLWTDMFPIDLTMPGPPTDVTPRKPTEYELRIIIWNTDNVRLDEVNIMGEQSSDIYVKGWLEGNKEFRQETDVHYRSTDGSGMFNWRFVFKFMFHKSEEKIITKKKASLFSVDLTEEKHPANLYLQVWDADLISADDILGDFIAPLTRLPSPAKSSKSCDLSILTDESRFGSIIKAKHMKGWWPFQYNPDDDDDPNPILAGKVEVELELLSKEDAEAAPAGKGREEPQPLSKPNRPSDSFGLFMSPLKMLKYFLWDSYKWCLLKALVVALLLALMGLFFYSMPGYTVKKIFGA